MVAARRDDRINVGRLTVDCAVPRDHPDPPAVRRRLDDAGERLASALGEILDPLSKLGDEVIVIRKLELDFELDTSASPAELARAWAARIAAGVAAHLRPEAHASMLRFPDEAHYLARFLVDSVAGPAEQRWYYKRWRGIAALSLAARLRSALVEEPARAVAALAALTPSELLAVLAALGPREARRVVEAAAEHREGGDAGDFDRAARSIVALVPAWLPIVSTLASPWQAGLALVARTYASLAAADVRPAVALAAALAAIALDPQLRAGAAPPATTILDGAGVPAVASLLQLAPQLRRDLLAPLGANAATPAAIPASWYTRLGGLLLLLPRIAELRLEELFGDDVGRAQLHVLARASGPYRQHVLTDPLWRRLCGVSPDADIELGAWLSAPRIDRWSAASWHRAALRARTLQVVATRHDRPLIVVANEPDGEWLAIAPLTPALRSVLRRSSTLVMSDRELSARVSLVAGQAAAHTLSWLAPALDDPAELALTLAAQHVLRAFARRLPGFAESTPRFLFDSFLDFDATIIATDDAFHCRVGRPRLAALFGVTGALRGRLAIGGGGALELYPE
jgi:hypothetical protein